MQNAECDIALSGNLLSIQVFYIFAAKLKKDNLFIEMFMLDKIYICKNKNFPPLFFSNSYII